MRNSVAHHVRHMLNESSTQSDIDDLRTAADSQGGKLRSHSVSGQRQLDLITFRIDHVNGGMMNSPVQRGIDIPATRQQQAVKFLKEFLPVRLARRQEDRQTAGASDRLDIFGTKGESIVVISSVAGNTNQGSCHLLDSFKIAFTFPVGNRLGKC